MDIKRKSITREIQHELDNGKTEEQHDIPETGWAWLVLIGQVLNRALTDGVAGSLAVFIIAWQDYFTGSLTELTWAISLIWGLQFILGPTCSVLLKRFSIREVVMTGAILSSSAFIAASFATQVWHLYLTSTIAGVGFGVIYTPSCTALTYYFDRRLGVASGLAAVGASIGFLVLPLLFQTWITAFGWKGAMLILAALVANIGVCASLYRPTTSELKVQIRFKMMHMNQTFESQTPGSRRNSRRQSIIEAGDLPIFTNIYFILGLVAYLLYGCGAIIPIHYLAVAAVSKGISKPKAAFLISSIGIGTFVSKLTHGVIIDRHILKPSTLISLAFLMGSISNTLTPFCDAYPVLVTIAVLHGLSSGVYSSTTTILAKEYVGLRYVSGSVGWLLLTNGCGIILGSYLTGVLVDATDSYDFPFYLAGICFIICALFISAKSVYEHLKHIYRTIATKTQNSVKESDGKVNKGAEFDDRDSNITIMSRTDFSSDLFSTDSNNNIFNKIDPKYSVDINIKKEIGHDGRPKAFGYRTWLVTYV